MIRKELHKVYLLPLIGLMVLVLLMKPTPGLASEVRGVTDDVIKVGMIGDLTGPIADTWMEAAEGFRNYMQYVNDRGGIHGRKIKLIVEDDRYSIPAAIAVFKKLVYKDGILTMLGASGTAGTIALFSQIEKDRLPTLSASEAEPMYKPLKRYIFCPAAGYSEEVKVLFDIIMKDFKVKDPKIGIVYPDVGFGKTYLEQAEKSAAHYGVKLYPEVLSLSYLDASSQVLWFKRRKVDFVIVAHLVGGAVAFLKETKKLRLEGTFFAARWACSEDVIKAVGDAAKNYYGTHAYSSWYDDTPGMAKAREITLKLNPGKKMYTKTYAKGWLSGMIIAEGLRRAGRNLNNESLVDAWETFKNFDTEGVSGSITYGPNQRMGGEYLKLYKADVANNKLIPLTGWIKAAH